MVGSNLREFVHPDDAIEVMQQLDNQLAVETASLRSSFEVAPSNVTETYSSFSRQSVLPSQSTPSNFSQDGKIKSASNCFCFAMARNFSQANLA